MSAPTWQLLAQLDRLHQLQELWFSRQPDPRQLSLIEEERPATRHPLAISEPDFLAGRRATMPELSDMSRWSETG